MRHDLKCWPEYFAAVVGRLKTFELRKDDRGYRVGDELILREWDPKLSGYTGASTVVQVKYIARDLPTEFGLEPGYCIMGFVAPVR